MFTLQILVNRTSLEAVKTDLTKALPAIKSSHRVEALARGLGFRTYAALLAATTSNKTAAAVANGASFTRYLRDHEFDAPEKSLYIAVARVAIQSVLERTPRLSMSGIGAGAPRRKLDGKWENAREHYARFLGHRDQLMSEAAVDGFLLALAFVSRVNPTKTIRPKTSSYWLKHIAEKFTCFYADGYKLGPCYVSNGQLIAAAIYSGFKYKTFVDEQGYAVSYTHLTLPTNREV